MKQDVVQFKKNKEKMTIVSKDLGGEKPSTPVQKFCALF